MPELIPEHGKQTVPGTEIEASMRNSRQPTSPDQIIQEIGNAYLDASPAMQCRMIETLLKPLSLLSLVFIADGTFARLIFSNGSIRNQILVDDLSKIQFAEVQKLIDHSFQVNAEVLKNILLLIGSSSYQSIHMSLEIATKAVFHQTLNHGSTDNE